MTSRKGLLAVLLFGLLLPIVAAHLYLSHRIALAAGEVLAPLSDLAEIQIGEPFYRMNGHFGVRSLQLVPRHEELEPTRSGRITVQSPGWLWTLRALHQPAAANRLVLTPLLPPQEVDEDDIQRGPPAIRRLPSARQLGIEIEALELGFNGLLPSPFDSIGWASAALFETEGCEATAGWGTEDLRAMGLTPGALRWQWEYRVTGPGEVHSLASLHAPGVSRFEQVQRLASPSAEDHLSNDPRADRLQAETISLRDEGFVQARNRFCVERDASNLPVFLQRHWQSIEQQLASVGLQASGELRSTYLRFARDGGELILQADPAPGAAQPGDPLSQRLRLYNASLRRGEAAPVALRFQTISNTPSDGAATTDGSDPGPQLAEASSDPAGAAQIRQDAASLALALTQLMQRGRPSIFALAAPHPGEPPKVSDVTEAIDIVNQAAPTQPDAAPRITPLEDSPTAAVSRELTYEQLALNINRVVRIYMADGRSRIGTIEAVSKDSVRLEVSLPSGSANYDIARENIRRAYLIE